MADTCSPSGCYVYDLMPPRKDSLWSAIVTVTERDKIHRNNEKQHLSALSRAVLKEIQSYDKQRATNCEKKTKFALVLTTDTATLTPGIGSHQLPHLEDSWVCAICLDALPEKNPNSVSCLTCQFCVPCLTQYVQLQIEEKSVNMTSKWSMRCPCLLEGCELSTTDVERIIQGNDNEITDDKKTIMAKFRKFALDLEIQNDSSRGKYHISTHCYH